MDKKLLLEKYVRVAIKKAIQEQEARQKKAEKAMYLIYRFPGLRKSIEELMSPSFGRFVIAVDLVAFLRVTCFDVLALAVLIILNMTSFKGFWKYYFLALEIKFYSA